jgi:hypothetical protein
MHCNVIARVFEGALLKHKQRKSSFSHNVTCFNYEECVKVSTMTLNLEYLNSVRVPSFLVPSISFDGYTASQLIRS